MINDEWYWADEQMNIKTDELMLMLWPQAVTPVLVTWRSIPSSLKRSFLFIRREMTNSILVRRKIMFMRKVSFCQKLILPKTVLAGKYIMLFRWLSSGVKEPFLYWCGLNYRKLQQHNGLIVQWESKSFLDFLSFWLTLAFDPFLSLTNNSEQTLEP